MNKAAEVALLQSWIAQAPPDSYLASMLHYIAPRFEQDARSDFHTLPDLAEIQREHQAAEARLSAVKREIRTAEAQLDGVNLRIRVGGEELEKIRDSARRIIAIK